MGSGFAPGGGIVAAPLPAIVWCARPHRAWGRALRCLFGGGGSSSGPGAGGGGGARSALKSRGEALPPAPAFLFGRPGGPWAPGPPNAAAPPGRCGFLPAKRAIRHPFPTSASYKQNEPAAPHERRAGIFRRKTEEVFQLVFPRFFQKRAGSRGRAPGGVRDSAPEKAPKAPTRHPSAGRDWARRRRVGKSPWG